jgi:hypothetical protein
MPPALADVSYSSEPKRELTSYIVLILYLHERRALCRNDSDSSSPGRARPR